MKLKFWKTKTAEEKAAKKERKKQQKEQAQQDILARQQEAKTARDKYLLSKDESKDKQPTTLPVTKPPETPEDETVDEEQAKKTDEFERRVEQLKKRRTDAKGSENANVKKLLDAALIKRRILKAEYDKAVANPGIGPGKSKKKIKQKELDKLDAQIRRLLDTAATVLKGGGSGEMTTTALERLMNEAESVEELGSSALDRANDITIAKELGLITNEEDFSGDISEQLDAIKQRANEAVEDEGLDDFTEKFGDKFKDVDSDPRVAALIAERNKLQVEDDRLDVRSGTYRRQKKLRAKVEKLEIEIQKMRQEVFILKYAFGEDSTAKSKFVAETMAVSGYKSRKKAGVKRKPLKKPGKGATDAQKQNMKSKRKSKNLTRKRA